MLGTVVNIPFFAFYFVKTKRFLVADLRSDAWANDTVCMAHTFMLTYSRYRCMLVSLPGRCLCTFFVAAVPFLFTSLLVRTLLARIRGRTNAFLLATSVLANRFIIFSTVVVFQRFSEPCIRCTCCHVTSEFGRRVEFGHTRTLRSKLLVFFFF